jgi:hypothetical protein
MTTSKLEDHKKTIKVLESNIAQMRTENSKNYTELEKFCRLRENKQKEVKQLESRISESSREIKRLSELLTSFGLYLPLVNKVYNKDRYYKIKQLIN